MWLLFAFIAVPLIEIALFVQVGGLIGLWPTLAIVILTALAGTALLRRQGFREMSKLRGALSNADDPSEPLAHGAMILFAGVLLLTPGFFTDAVGFALLLPPLRAWLFAQIRKRIVVHDMTRPDIIEGEYEAVEPDQADPSGWTRH